MIYRIVQTNIDRFHIQYQHNRLLAFLLGWNLHSESYKSPYLSGQVRFRVRIYNSLKEAENDLIKLKKEHQTPNFKKRVIKY